MYASDFTKGERKMIRDAERMFLTAFDFDPRFEDNLYLEVKELKRAERARGSSCCDHEALALYLAEFKRGFLNVDKPADKQAKISDIARRSRWATKAYLEGAYARDNHANEDGPVCLLDFMENVASAIAYAEGAFIDARRRRLAATWKPWQI